MQEHDVAARVGGAHMHVDSAVVRGRERGQLEVVRGKQGVGLCLVVQLRGNRRGQRQAVEGAGAAPDLVHQHQRLRRGAVQDLRRLQHLQHEGGLRVGQVVGGADAGVNAIDRSDDSLIGRDITTDVRQEGNQSNLTHIGGLTAHIRASDDEHTALFVQVEVIRNER